MLVFKQSGARPRHVACRQTELIVRCPHRLVYVVYVGDKETTGPPCPVVGDVYTLVRIGENGEQQQ